MAYILHRRDKYGHDTQRYENEDDAYTDKDRYYQKYGHYGGSAWVVKEGARKKRRIRHTARVRIARAPARRIVYRRAPVRIVYRVAPKRVIHRTKHRAKRSRASNPFMWYNANRIGKAFGW